jgi:hypothetical protein
MSISVTYSAEAGPDRGQNQAGKLSERSFGLIREAMTAARCRAHQIASRKKVNCQIRGCDDEGTRLPSSIRPSSEISRINSPTIYQPLHVLCSKHGHLSTYTHRGEIESGADVQSSLEEFHGFWSIEIECDEPSCDFPRQAYKRIALIGVTHSTIPDVIVERAAKVWAGKCSAGHRLNVKKAELREVPEG